MKLVAILHHILCNNFHSSIFAIREKKVSFVHFFTQVIMGGQESFRTSIIFCHFILRYLYATICDLLLSCHFEINFILFKLFDSSGQHYDPLVSSYAYNYFKIMFQSIQMRFLFEYDVDIHPLQGDIFTMRLHVIMLFACSDGSSVCLKHLNGGSPQTTNLREH